jgi:hypothetical protein
VGTVVDEMIAFLHARLDEEETAARDHLCIHCREPTIPLRSPLGVTGYTHRGAWQGRRCPNQLTGAEPVQDPARVLREVAAKRERLALYLDAKEALAAALEKAPPEGDPATAHSYVRERINVNQASGRFAALEMAVRLDAAVDNGHPDFRQEWAP